MLVTDEAGQQVWSAEFTPFGKQVSKDGELDHVTQFTGKDLDEDTGLYYFNARWYDQETGRFISEDPGRDPNNPNLYTYCQNNPLTITDPTGLLSENEQKALDNGVSRYAFSMKERVDLGKTLKETAKNLWNSLLGFSESYDTKQEEYKVDKKLIDEDKGTYRDRRVGDKKPEDAIEAVIVHWVGVANQDALETLGFFNDQPSGGSSAHYIVGLKGEVIQAVPDEKAAFHAGGPMYTELANERFKVDGVRKHNDFTIGIETEVIDKKGNYNKQTYTTFVRLTADLLKKYGLDAKTDLLRHYDITNKDCPKLFEGENNKAWETFKSDVEKAMKRMK